MNTFLITSEMRVRLTVLMTVLMLSSPLRAAFAQGGPPGGDGRQRGVSEQQRSAMEAQFQDRLNAIVRRRLSLNDDQYARLRDVASKSEKVRRDLRREEMMLRTALRQEILAGDRADEAKVGELLDRMPGLERRKLDIMEREQQELSKFLSPLQRARYFGLQDELRRGMQELQRRRLERTEVPREPGQPRPPRRGGGPPPF